MGRVDYCDGKLDIWTTRQILLGKGDGTLRPVSTDGPIGDSGVIADVNGDGKLDIVTTRGTQDTAHVFLGKGDGSFRESPRAIAGISTDAKLALGDFDRDGTLDLAAANANGVDVFRGKGDGSFGTAARAGVTRQGRLSVADLNSDGWTDLVASDATGLSVLLNDHRW